MVSRPPRFSRKGLRRSLPVAVPPPCPPGDRARHRGSRLELEVPVPAMGTSDVGRRTSDVGLRTSDIGRRTSGLAGFQPSPVFTHIDHRLTSNAPTFLLLTSPVSRLPFPVSRLPSPVSLIHRFSSLFTVYRSRFTLRRRLAPLRAGKMPALPTLLTVHCSLFTVHGLPFTVHRSPFLVARCSPSPPLFQGIDAATASKNTMPP